MSLAVSPSYDQLFVKLQAFLIAILPANTPVLRGPVNRAAQPAVDHVVMTPLFQRRLRTNVETYDPPDDTVDTLPGARTIVQGTEVHVQFDFYGLNAGDWAGIVSTVWRDSYACEALEPIADPLYIDSGRMAPRITGEEQFLERWTQTAVMQYNPATTVPQQFADAADVLLVEVDERYPP